MYILIIEDEQRITDFLRRGLEAEGFVIEQALDGRRGIEMALQDHVDLVILDLMLPEVPGERVLEAVRAVRPDLPVIVLSAKGDLSDRVDNLNSGADDYVTKPFSFSELLARINARLRTRGQASSTELTVGAVTLDLRTRHATVDSRPHDLTSREFALLETFMRHEGQVLSHMQLVDRVWGYDFDPGSNVVEVYVSYLRKKLGSSVIETVRGTGYRFTG